MGDVPANSEPEKKEAVTLVRGIRARITVLGPEGRPVPGAIVVVFGPSATRRITQSACNDDGEVLLPALDPGGEYRLHVNPGRDPRGLLERSAKWTPASRSTVRLEGRWAVTGEVLDWTGRRVGGVPVWYREEEQEGTWSAWRASLRRFSRWRVRRRLRSCRWFSPRSLTQTCRLLHWRSWLLPWRAWLPSQLGSSG